MSSLGGWAGLITAKVVLDDLATHLRITMGFTVPFDLKDRFSFTQLLVRTAQQTHRLVPPAAQDDLGEGVVLGPCASALGFTTGLWLAAARAECKGNKPCTSYSRTFTIHNYGYGIAYAFTHNNITLEHTAMNDKNTITHTDAYNTQF